MPAFFDGNGTWKVRFSPDQVGDWSGEFISQPRDPELHGTFHFDVTPSEARGFLRSVPDAPWGFQWENGDGFFPLGDTTYNLFGKQHCGHDVAAYMDRRLRQGFNLLRVRLPVSRFHPPAGLSAWQSQSCWQWGGSEQSPVFESFNLDYFASVDEVVFHAERIGMGLEMIMEAWGFEFPFNSRVIFTPERELFWLRYLIARYDAFTSTMFWTPMNEYEYYPNGDWNYKEESYQWQIRIARWIKTNAPHGHMVAVHNGPTHPPFAERFARDLEASDVVMYQNWGASDEQQGWLATGIDRDIDTVLAGWPGSAILAEWGYEVPKGVEPLFPYHAHCDRDHTRRGAWRAVFSGLGIIHGFEYTWGPLCVLDKDLPGVADLVVLREFVHAVIGNRKMIPRRDLASSTHAESGYQPLCLQSDEGDLVLLYLPAGDDVSLNLDATSTSARWFNPVSGEMIEATADGQVWSSPVDGAGDRPTDWILVIDRKIAR